MSFTYDLNGLKLDVQYEYEPAQHGGMTDPSWEAYVTVTEVLCDGIDIIDYLKDGVIEDINQQIEQKNDEY
jgi:hypothetical protein